MSQSIHGLPTRFIIVNGQCHTPSTVAVTLSTVAVEEDFTPEERYINSFPDFVYVDQFFLICKAFRHDCLSRQPNQ